jgi:hypothetical protein
MGSRDKWIWMPHPAHFICGSQCKFHLATYVGKYIVSTVGEYLPDYEVREIFAKCRGVMLEGRGDERTNDYMRKIGFEDIGVNRKYETMVFKAKKNLDKHYKCCPWQLSDFSCLEMEGYNDPGKASEGHYKLCEKWGGT